MKKAIKNHAKMDQKSMKNQSKIGQNRGLEASWGILGHLVASLGVLRAPRTAKRRPKTRLGASWLEKGGQHGSNLAPKTEPKSRKNRSKNRSKFWCLLGSDFFRILVDFGGKMEPSWHQNRIKNRSQLRKAIFWKNLIFPMEKQWFWRFWGSKLGRKIDQKSIKKWSHLGKVSWHRFFMNFGGFWRPSWRQVGSKIDEKSIKKNIEK